MRKLLLLLVVSLICTSTFSQEPSSAPVKKEKKFFIGISWSSLSINLELKDLSLSSNWYGQDLGTRNLTSGEIDSINSYMDRTNTMNAILVEAGMTLYGKPGHGLFINGTLFAGIGESRTMIYNKSTAIEEVKSNSGLFKPCLGLGFTFNYSFSQHWGLILKPTFISTFGTATDITDKLTVSPDGFTMTINDQYRSFFERISLMANYNIWHLSFSAGPGFYWLQSHHNYTITRTSNSGNTVLYDEKVSSSAEKSFFDGCIAVEWRIIEPLTFYAVAGIGNDFMINTGLHFNF